jgi:hypothetical protein
MKRLSVFIFVLAAWPAAFAQESSGMLKLRQGYGSTAPSGAVLRFSVDARPGAFQRIYLAGEGVDGTPSVTTPPYELSIWVPRAVTGLHRFRAVGVNGAGQLQFSEPVALNLTPADAPESITTPLSNLRLSFIGDAAPLRLVGHFGDGGKADLTPAAATSFESSDPSVVRVDPGGRAVATGPGTAEIRIHHGDAATLVHVTVPPFVAGDLNGDGKVDQDDVSILTDALGTTPTPGRDARDLNRDGKIDAADLALLKGLCTQAGCVRE